MLQKEKGADLLFCWWCQENFDKYRTGCPTCGLPKDLPKELVRYIEQALKA